MNWSPPHKNLIAKTLCPVISHIARLTEVVPANQALRCHVNALLGRPPHHLIIHGDVDQAAHATTGYSKFVRILALLQLICGPGGAIKRGHGATLRPRLATQR